MEKVYKNRESAKECLEVLLLEYEHAIYHEGRATLLREIQRVKKLLQAESKRYLLAHINTCMQQLESARTNFENGHWEASARIHKAMRLDLTDDAEVTKAVAEALIRRKEKYEQELIEAETIPYELDELYDSFGLLGMSNK